MYRWNPDRPTGLLPGTLYVPSIGYEFILSDMLRRRINSANKAIKAISTLQGREVIISTQSSTTFFHKFANYIDYIFVDPPFGANLMYSELNFLWEAWLRVFTDNAPEAVVNRVQGKGLPEYQALMEACFREFYRVLKPGRWMTVEFHNSQNAVWLALQEALERAGFVVADVRVLDKQQRTFKQVTTTTAVHKDLIISAYKPTRALEERFAREGGSEEAAWDFVRRHLEQLPLPTLSEDGTLAPVEERTDQMLFDRMVAFHVQRGLPVPLSAAAFYKGLRERFVERDGMFFTHPQAARYDTLRARATTVGQMSLFVTDERSAIQWLRRQLQGRPQTYAKIQPKFLQELQGLKRHEKLPELRDLLEDNFLQDDQGRWYVPDPDKQEDLERLREKELLREFALYLKSKGRLRVFRSEAVRAGFRKAWREGRYADILAVANRLPRRAIEEDPQLLMYVDNARLRLDTQPQQGELW